MTSLKGQFLIASTTLTDPNFIRTVLLIIEHNEAGAAGIVLNRPTAATIAEISEQVFEEPEDWAKPIHLGGPVPGPLLALHSNEELADQRIIDGLFTTVDPLMIRELIRLRIEPSMFLANYAGWGAGQLELELSQDSWLHTPADPSLVFGGEEESLWEVILRRVSVSQLVEMLGLENIPDDPSVN